MLFVEELIDTKLKGNYGTCETEDSDKSEVGLIDPLSVTLVKVPSSILTLPCVDDVYD